MSDFSPSNIALIIFVRHPELGKVKTRLAKTIGDQRTLAIYDLLLNHTFQITVGINCRKFIYYTEQVIQHDRWSYPGYTKRKQFGDDLGSRMSNAFRELFEQGFKKVLIIGSDCYQLEQSIIEKAAAALSISDIVIGPTFDGGYYLLGTTKYLPELFTNISWSTDQVTSQTLATINQLALKHIALAQLHDVDEEADLGLNGISI